MESTYTDSEDENKTLSDLFDDGLDIYERILKSEEDSSSSNYQVRHY